MLSQPELQAFGQLLLSALAAAALITDVRFRRVPNCLIPANARGVSGLGAAAAGFGNWVCFVNSTLYASGQCAGDARSA
jgi:hypothetical protein